MTAARIEALGIGRSIPWAKRHNRIGPVLKAVLGSEAMQARAKELAELVGPDGAFVSADLVERALEAKADQ